MDTVTEGTTVRRTTNAPSLRHILRAALAMAAVLLFTSLSGTAAADPCEVADAGGTVVLPPAGCDYLSPDEVHVIIDGLPPDTTIEFAPIHKDFICNEQQSCTAAIPPGLCEAPGGVLGGNADCFDSTLEFQVTGTGALAGFSRLVSLPAFTEVHTGPRIPGNSVQSFDTEMIQLQAQIGPDPDFATLNILAGSAFGLPSPGHTTLTLKSNGNFAVDSFFDITYQIDFVGAPGSVLDGMSGSTNAALTMATNVNPCDVVDNGTGTVNLPPDGCEYLSPDEVHEIIDGLPPGTTIELAAIHKNFICGNPLGTCSQPLPGGVCEVPGGTLGGNVDCFQSEAEFVITGTGALGGFSRLITMQLDTEVHTAPRIPGNSVQSFDSTMFRLQGQLFGDPDFCVFQFQGGDQFGLPSPGHTLLTDKGNGTFAVDSFFDITYQIDYQGCPGSSLEGLGGSTLGTLRMETGDPVTTGGGPFVSVPGLANGWFALFVLLAAMAWMLRRESAQA